MKSIFRPETNWFGGGGGLYDFFESSTRIGAFFVFLLRERRRSSRNGEYDNKLREWTVMRRVRRYNERINPFLPRSIAEEGGRKRKREKQDKPSLHATESTGGS